MVPSAGAQPRVIVKRRGSKFRVTDAKSLSDRDASGRDIANQDEHSLDPGRDRQAAALTK
ncbi:MAG TPA: hypothetical protein VMC83_42495 [Streptosporangiaceae bacterium]|nr:hypothetical protein [Streptosporangiaceae bacterium]